MYRVAYIKTFFDNLVFPYLVSEDMEIVNGKKYIVNTKFGEDIGLAMSGVKYISIEQFPLKKPHPHVSEEVDLSNLNHHDVQNDLAELKKIIKDEHSADTLVAEEGIEKKIENFKVLREAKDEEIKSWEKLNEGKEKAFQDTLKLIKEMQLPMRLISVYFMLEKKKVIFNFTAENRVDFRELVKKLASIYKTRIEMRQIGVRDASKIIENYGVCGLKTCCTRSNCHINSIYLKMAKDQGFLVNSSKLTGVCGRLICCLAYEADFYATEREKYPPVNSIIRDGGKTYHVVSSNLITTDVYGEDENRHLKKFKLSNLKLVSKNETETIYENNNGELNAL